LKKLHPKEQSKLWNTDTIQSKCIYTGNIFSRNSWEKCEKIQHTVYQFLL